MHDHDTPDDRTVPGVEPYDGPAGGWGALRAVAVAVRDQMGASANSRALLSMNQPTGFDCPGCAWPDPHKTSSFEFCENGAKAVTWEATAKRVDSDFFARHTATELESWSDHALEDAGRLTHPLRYDAGTDHYVPIGWDEAFARIGAGLQALPDPNMAEFYTSGRASNEAAFLYQLMARAYGTNNFPDCSNMCHEATSVGLPQSIGVGKGTVTLEDFDLTDAIFCIGHNPGTNHPRMLSTLSDAAKRGVPIVVANPMKERGLERFKSPQHPSEMLTPSSTRLASAYHQVKVGGDGAMLKGMMKVLFEKDALDHAFIAEHTQGIEVLRADIAATGWDEIVAGSGLSREAIESMADTYARASRVILCYGMGITQHAHGTQNVHHLANLMLLGGNMGKPGAGICPLRGHSNVQGDRTVGITEIPTEAMLGRQDAYFGFTSPRAHGHSAVDSLSAMREGRSRALICLGGNLAVAMPDPEACFPAFRKLDLLVCIITKFNRTCLLRAKDTIVLPCLGRTELDVQAGGDQWITVEDSMSMVHASRGMLQPAAPDLRSEPAIIAGIAKATLRDCPVDWDALVGDYDRIRDGIEAVYPDFHDFNARVRVKGGFRLTVEASERVWKTPSGKAQFIAHPLDAASLAPGLLLTTIRSHDQYNTTIYGLNDRYRGITGRRDVIFAHANDLAALGLAHGDTVDVSAGEGRVLRGYTVVAHAIAQGSLAAYYPEANCLIPLEDHDRQSGTPSYKSVRVTLARSLDQAA